MAFKNISVILSATTGDLSRGLEQGAKQIESFGIRARAVSANMSALGAVLGIVAVASVRLASDFQKSMELIHTQAGASQAEVDAMKNSILALAPAVGQGPVKLADAMYHIESIGLRGAKALDVLHTAAMGAQIGNADLEATTNALASTIASNIGGFHGMKDAMAILNNTVGQGNMRMDDLAASMSTGVLPAAKTAGLGLIDVGAALATMTDTGVPAEEAATRLRMTFALMSAPTGAATKALKDIGLTNTDLANDMHRPNGLLVAVEDLRRHLGNLHTTAGQIAAEDTLVKAFGGGRSSGAIMTLIQEVDRLQTKYQSYGTVASRQATFQDAWAKTTETFAFRMHQFGAELQVVAIRVGTVLLPVITGAVTGLEHLAHWAAESVRFLSDHKAAVAAVAAAWAVLKWGSIASAATTAMFNIRAAIGLVQAQAYLASLTVGGLSGALSKLGAAVVVAAAVYEVARAFQAVHDAGKGTADQIHAVMDQLGQRPNVEGLADARAELVKMRDALHDPAGPEPLWHKILFGRDALRTAGPVADYKKSMQELQTEIDKLSTRSKNLATNTAALGRQFSMSGDAVVDLANKSGIDLTGSLNDVTTAFAQAVAASMHLGHMSVDLVAAYAKIDAAQRAFAPTVKDATDVLGKQYDMFDALPNKIKLSGAALLKNIADQTRAMLAEGANVRKLVQEGLDPGMIKALVDKGPEYVAAAASLSIKDIKTFATEYHQNVSAGLTTANTIAKAEAPKAYQAVIDAINAKNAAIAAANERYLVSSLVPALAHAKTLSTQGGKDVVNAYGDVISRARPSMLEQYLKTLPDPLAQAIRVALGVSRKGGTDMVVNVAEAIVAATPRAGGAAKQITKAIQDEINALRGTKVTISVDEILASATFSAERNLMFPYSRTAAGGPITGGRPGRDSVPVLAMPGEHMLTVADVDALGGHAGVFALRKALHLAAGGPVVVDYLRHPPAGMVAPPAQQEAARLIGQTIKLLGFGAMPSAGAGGANQWAGTALAVLAALHQPAGLLAGLLRRVNFESGGDPTAVNRSDINWQLGHPSVGLMQVIAGTFARWAGPYRGVGPYEYGVSVNPFANMYAGANYAIHTYGSLSAVDPVNRPRGYDSGGWLPPGLSLAYNGTGRPEPVGAGARVTVHAPVTITISGAGSAEQTAVLVERRLTKAFGDLAQMVAAGTGRG